MSEKMPQDKGRTEIEGRAVGRTIGVEPQEKEISEEVRLHRELYEKRRSELRAIEQAIKEGSGDLRYLEQEAESKLRDIEDIAPHAGIPDREVWKDKDPFVFREKNVRALKRLLSEWHDIRPDYVFLTETSSVPYGYAIKEAWKTAYPDEKAPVFYRLESWTEHDHAIDVNPFLFQGGGIDRRTDGVFPEDPELPILEKIQEGITRYLKDRIKSDAARIIIFDEYDKPITPRQISHPDEMTWSRSLRGPTKEMMKSFPNIDLYYAGINDYGVSHSSMDFGRFNHPVKKQYPRVTLKRNVDSAKKKKRMADPPPWNNLDSLEEKTTEEIRREILEKGYRPFGRMIKDPERRKEALQYISDLKEIGRIAGREFYENNHQG
ncbi:MAG: hypothetical protein RDU25_05085 [Patescibacteria group bacterium]|nr:hypothetical protein [Patescibacteria group bacterium]